MQSKKPRLKDSEEELYDYAVRALSRKMRTVAELKRLMRPRVSEEHGAPWIESVIARLKEQKYLNDSQYAAAFTRMRQENQRFGRRRVQQDLMVKGVHGDVIATAVDSAYLDKDEAQMARAYLERKRAAKPKDEKETARLMRMLMRAGYSSGAIWKALKAWKVDADMAEAAEEFDSL
ncbi:MAG: hypothetical protein NVS9B15_05920 [Acidobacteriaceae bacterium]